jgi:hypothetical protein
MVCIGAFFITYFYFVFHLMVGHPIVLNRQTELVAITVVVSKLWLHLLAQTQMGAGRYGWLECSPR